MEEFGEAILERLIGESSEMYMVVSDDEKDEKRRK